MVSVSTDQYLIKPPFRQTASRTRVEPVHNKYQRPIIEIMHTTRCLISEIPRLRIIRKPTSNPNSLLIILSPLRGSLSERSRRNQVLHQLMVSVPEYFKATPSTIFGAELQLKFSNLLCIPTGCSHFFLNLQATKILFAAIPTAQGLFAAIRTAQGLFEAIWTAQLLLPALWATKLFFSALEAP